MCAHRLNKCIDTVRAEDMDTFIGYHWPGNVRELQNIVERCVILSPGPVLDCSPFADLRHAARTPAARVRTLAEAERDYILDALRDTEWVVGGPDGASARLGVKRTTLLYKMRRHGISRPQN
jgi:formate hydrogenlyase transcriptional activator